MVVHRFAAVAIATLFGCTSPGSPLDQIHAQVEVDVDPNAGTSPKLELAIETWNDLSALEDAVAGDQISVTLDGSPLVVDPTGTASLGQGDEFVAAFVLPDATVFSAVTTASTLAISDGVTTWQVQIANLFATDLSPTRPLAPGDNTLEWPSATPSGDLSTIAWACVEIVGASSSCGGDAGASDSSVVISQQYISAQIAASVGDRAVVTAERDVAPASIGPAFLTKIRNRYEQTLVAP